MRKGTKSFVSILSLGLVAAGYQAGQSAELPTSFSASPVTGSSANSGTSTGSESVTTPTATAAATPAATTAGSTPKTSSAGAAPASTPKATTAVPAPVSTPKATTAAPAPVATPTQAPATNTGSSTTKTGTAINYRYGTVQVSVTKANGKITAVNLLQQGATGGRQGAFPYLVQYAIAANGTSFGNLSGATYTVDAFKQSLESALAKF